MSGISNGILKKSILKGAIGAVLGVLVIASTIMFFLNWMEDGNATQMAAVVIALVVGVLLLLIGLLATASAVSFNSKVDLVNLERGLTAQRREYTEHTEHSDRVEEPRKK